MKKSAPFVLIFVTLILTILGLLLEIKVKEPGVLLLSFVIFGTGYDFFGSIAGGYTKNKKTLLFLAKTRFSFTNFGILFTPISAAFVLVNFSGSQYSKLIVSNYFSLLLFSLFTGCLFFFSQYSLKEEEGILECRLDRSDKFTNFAFILRRVVLFLSLVIAVIALVEGVGAEIYVWTLSFILCFIATIPLNILRKEIAAMFFETSTLVILIYGAYRYIL